MFSYFKKMWRGEIPLWQAFWLWGFAINELLLFGPNILALYGLYPGEIVHGLLNIFDIFIYLPLSARLINKNYKNIGIVSLPPTLKYVPLILLLLLIFITSPLI